MNLKRREFHRLALLAAGSLLARGAGAANSDIAELYATADATAMAEHVRSGRVSAMELLDEAIRRTEQVNPRDFTHPQYLHHWDTWNPMGRWGQPRDTAAAVLYLASDMAEWVTGTTVHVDGGALAAGGWYRMPDEQQRWTLAPVIKDSGFIY